MLADLLGPAGTLGLERVRVRVRAVRQHRGVGRDGGLCLGDLPTTGTAAEQVRVRLPAVGHHRGVGGRRSPPR